MSAGTKVAHTPGPWIPTTESVGLGRVIASLGQTMEGIHWKVAATVLVPDHELPANAYVIAAAKDLLAEVEALEWCIDIQGEGEAFGACPACGAIDYRGHHDGCSLNAALLKARGQS